MTDTTFEGGCACGQVRYRVNSEPLIVHGCHCSLCQRQTGTAFAQNALIEADRVELLSGEVEETILETPSGAGQKVIRCANCRIAVWSNYLVTGGEENSGEDLRFLRAGTLDEPYKMPPDVHIYISTKQPWVVLSPDTPAVETFYETIKIWPDESIKRLDILYGRNE